MEVVNSEQHIGSHFLTLQQVVHVSLSVVGARMAIAALLKRLETLLVELRIYILFFNFKWAKIVDIDLRLLYLLQTFKAKVVFEAQCDSLLRELERVTSVKHTKSLRNTEQYFLDTAFPMIPQL